MAAQAGNPNSPDAGLFMLVTLLRFNDIGADAEQIRHRFGGSLIGIPEMLRAAKDFGLKARARVTSWARLPNTPLPAIAALRDGGFLFLGKVGDDKALVQAFGAPRSSLMTREEFEAVWDGRRVLMTRRAGLLDLSRRFDITWFLGAIHKYRRMLGEVLVASFFLQVFALISPLFFQVVIDKVLVHRSMSTLDVLIIGTSRSRCLRRSWESCAPICSRTRRTASMLSLARVCFVTLSRCRLPIFRAGSAIRLRACASLKTSEIFSPARR
jgi:subfamily B ATP-binding cassette protein HlyB/CyaB